MAKHKTGALVFHTSSRPNEGLWPAEWRDAERRGQRRARACGIAALVVLAVLVWGIGW